MEIVVLKTKVKEITNALENWNRSMKEIAESLVVKWGLNLHIANIQTWVVKCDVKLYSLEKN